MGDVYFTGLNGSPGNSVLDKLKKLCIAAGLGDVISDQDLVAIKLHFGELGNTRMLRPQFVNVIVNLARSMGGQPFLTDCNTLFYRNRLNAVCHLETAGFNVFSPVVTGAQVIIADGLKGLDYRLARFAEDLEETKVGAAIYDADKLLVITHFKGHDDVGFGGIIKNLGMGAIARAGKQKIHSHVKPGIDQTLCDKCGLCIGYCPRQAIRDSGEGLRIDGDQCDNCGNCLAACPRKAIPIRWERNDREMQKKLVESFAAVLSNKKGRYFFVNFLTDITAYCDCRSWSPVPLAGDIGILAGKDPLSIEQASLDLVDRAVKEAHGGKGLFEFTGIDGGYQLEYAQRLGLGSREYRLVVIDE